MRSSDELLLHYCCALAWQHQTLALPNPSVGAIVVAQNGEILATGVHIIAGSPHAEVLAIQAAYYKLTGDKQILNLTKSEDIHHYLLSHHQGIFQQCALYVSLEPCNHQGKTPPCAALVAALKFAKVCIAMCESHSLAAGGLTHLLTHNLNAFYVQSPAVQHIAQSLLLPFHTLRNKGRFTLFKLAKRLDGSYKNGHISHQDAQIFTHNQRSVCDYICISGNTLRHDNPLLNARYAIPPYNSLATQQVFILSRIQKSLESLKASTCADSQDSYRVSKMLETSYNALKHRIHFSDNPGEIENLQGFVIIEGGFELLATLRKNIDMLLIHQSLEAQHAEGEYLTHSFSGRFTLLHQMTLGEDIALWLQ
ncbi:bifunctional diaminohydroxyphosphoribosylaminopyrimidine deaminase/5-amino-6-(5-phosphoribosylamino)uracil reductase RibD [Helicobacter mastomyrinus]|uniref:Bifunctional diaminohydroxyphosphoribosylaminopyrimidine deaminase/5-amino-6-(5-phosphoribosylamino)uracil reductase RibD n=1 Tax=Helicobacter mastomyrinus TaxID=287948 RepID=A0ABZ3F9T2_9HELI